MVLGGTRQAMNSEYPMIVPQEAAQLLGYRKPRSLEEFRARSDIHEGIHYVRLSSKKLLYNQRLLEVFVHNGPEGLREAEKNYLAWKEALVK